MLPLSEGWCVDDHLFKDLPALVDMIVRETGSQQLHWIGGRLTAVWEAEGEGGKLGRKGAQMKHRFCAVVHGC
jgi:hypothetical protein